MVKKRMLPKELVKAVREECSVRFVDCRYFTGLSTYGAYFHVAEKDWSDKIVDEVLHIINGTNYQMSVTHGNCVVKDRKVINTVSIDISVKQ